MARQSTPPRAGREDRPPGFDTDSDSDPDTDEASPVRSMKQSKTRNRFGINTQDISTA
jgi:hypothetical protein